MKKIHFLVCFLAVYPVYLFAQQGAWGKFQTQLRLYSMMEDNQDPLLDNSGTAIGGKIRYETPQWNNIHGVFGIYGSGFLKDNVSSDRLEPLAGNKGSRYVAGLVDTTNLDNNHVAGVGEAYLSYLGENLALNIGRFKLDTPFINPQDGRMLPTLEQGIWAKVKVDSVWSIQSGFINAFWNRSTPDWKDVEDSLGYGYELGKSVDGVNGNYYANTSSEGVFVANLCYERSALRIDLWDYYVENIFNLGYIEALYTQKSDPFTFIYGVQGIYESEVGDGGNNEDYSEAATDVQKAKSYMAKDEESMTYGAKFALEYQTSRVTLAYNRTTDRGRFLFPREWGKEPLYTFQKRERSDGSGNSHAWLVTVEHDFSNYGIKGLSMLAGYGEYDKSDPKEWRYNKYGTPSYAQWNIDLFYRFQGALKGLRAEYLIARKVARGETYQESGYSYIYRKNGMNIHNFILNYDF